MARDLIRGCDPVQVRDKLASQSLARWDRLAARMLPIGTEVHMAGGVLPLSFESSGALLDEFAEARKSFTRSMKRQAKRAGVPVGDIDQHPVEDAVLGEMAPMFTYAWLITTLRGALMGSLPDLVNFDGDALIFSETRFPIPDPARFGEIERRLDGLPDLVRDEAGQPTWTWLADAAATGPAPAMSSGAMMIKSYDESGGRILGPVQGLATQGGGVAEAPGERCRAPQPGPGSSGLRLRLDVGSAQGHRPAPMKVVPRAQRVRGPGSRAIEPVDGPAPRHQPTPRPDRAQSKGPAVRAAA
ncbi:hypothetical protein JL101_031595 (plasmid) [Skermanella rosea]|uniref:hypothetical protein n=1 Tax=Skermanella rosea TaxID=1817965 RepID=UPI001931EE9D|nr:hypothetical protein [Skermanella rosea]UEM07479.1 hypothetical protein JL101_031595 [Skermanella rosea]